MASLVSPGALPAAFVDALRAHVGERLSTAIAVREHHSRDESYHPPSLPDAVLFAASTDEVQAAVALCAAHGVPIVPFGAGTSLEGHVIPVRGGLSIDFARMTRVLRVSVDDMDADVQPGVTHRQLNQHLRNTGLMFAVDPGADATLGGMAATRASGTMAVRYGTMRENVLAMQVVLADGRLLKTSSRARKSAAGYDLTRLFVGSEGTLGIITQLTLRLHPRPEAMSVAVCQFPSIAGAVTTAMQTMQLGLPVARIELLDERMMVAINRYSNLSYADRPTLFLEFHGDSEDIVEDQTETVDAIAREHGADGFTFAMQAEEREKLWRARHDAYFASLALSPGARALTTDVCVPISRLAECVIETQQDNAVSFLQSTIAGHVGDGNFHVLYLIDPNEPRALDEAKRLNARMVARALAMGGTCTGEHGVGLGKRDYLIAEHGDVAIDVMQRLERALDPAGLLNPGKILRND
jgi:D-lactate dehydrogenase (cytochrome)